MKERRVKIKTKKYPFIDENLIKALQDDFPNKLPENEISSFKLGFLSGQQSIINKLKTEMEVQAEGVE